MNNKQVMKNKIKHLENALIEADFTFQAMELKMRELQEKINKYKITDDPKHLIQNNDLIIELIQKRLDIGAQRYGQNVPILPEDDITRDNFYEAVEEALDLCVYLTAFMLRLMKEKENLEIERNKSKKNSTK
tara:strand:+ start:692 stop:1087 length:396 start_codon:yes stop_codon:yes gene_type:complete